jgi:hypothetical protein
VTVLYVLLLYCTVHTLYVRNLRRIIDSLCKMTADHHRVIYNSMGSLPSIDIEKGPVKQKFKKSNHDYYKQHQDNQLSPHITSSVSKSLPTTASLRAGYSSLTEREDIFTDDEQVTAFSADEFDSANNNSRARSLRTGRQRKRLAARSKGSEFRANRKKRRVYFCCISSEVDFPSLLDQLDGRDLFGRWKHRVYSDVLHLYKEEPEQTIASSAIPIYSRDKASKSILAAVDPDDTPLLYSSYQQSLHQAAPKAYRYCMDNDEERDLIDRGEVRRAISIEQAGYSSLNEDVAPGTAHEDMYTRISSNSAQEIFIFGMHDITWHGISIHMSSLPLIYPVSCHVTDFGAVVFWGVPRGEEAVVLKTLRHFVNKGLVGAEEFSSGEDDLAFVTSADIASIKIANDVIELPENSEPKQRLSVSFAIAQSSVLAIFESRIERKIEEYKYIPEALAAHGKVHLSELQLGMMIGEVFVIRHDVNLHTEILGTVQ